MWVLEVTYLCGQKLHEMVTKLKFKKKNPATVYGSMLLQSEKYYVMSIKIGG